MNGFFKQLGQDSVATWSFWATLILLLLTASITLVSYTNLPPFLPLFNQLPWGYARLGKTYELFIPIVLVLFLLICNFTLGSRLMNKNPLLARFLFITTVTLALLVSIFTIRLILVVV